MGDIPDISIGKVEDIVTEKDRKSKIMPATLTESSEILPCAVHYHSSRHLGQHFRIMP